MSSNEEEKKEKDGLVSLYLHFTHFCIYILLLLVL